MTALALFIAYPLLALLVAAVFAGLWHRRGRLAAGIAALGWGAYGLYEILMKARILCSGECNIRVDLLLIYPVLLVLSVSALVTSVLQARSTSQPSGQE